MKIQLDSNMSREELVRLHMYFKNERDITSDELETHLQENEMRMARLTKMDTKYKPIWDRYNYLIDRFIECKETMHRIIYYMTKINKEAKIERRRSRTTSV